MSTVRRRGLRPLLLLVLATVPLVGLLAACKPATGVTTTVATFAGPAVTIPDGSTTGARIDLAVATSGTVRGVDLQLGGACRPDGQSTSPGISHPWRSDLVGTLTSPAGTTVTLFSHDATDADDFCGTWFTDAAASSITSQDDEISLPLAFPYRPIDPLSTFAGEDAQGTWTFKVADTVAGHTGKPQVVNSFKLRVTTGSASNTAPTATADTIVARSGSGSVIVGSPGPLANDTDPDQDALTMVPTTMLSGLQWYWNPDGSYQWYYALAPGGTCPKSFQYRAYDGAAWSTPVTAAIACVNGPTANPDSYTTPVDAPLTVAAPGVLANDTAGGPYPMIAVRSQAATHGTVEVGADGSFTFTPDAGYVGPASFAYYAALSAIAYSAPVTVTIDVQAPAAAPAGGSPSHGGATD